MSNATSWTFSADGPLIELPSRHIPLQIDGFQGVSSAVALQIKLFDSVWEMNRVAETNARHVCRKYVEEARLCEAQRPGTGARGTQGISDEESLGSLLRRKCVDLTLCAIRGNAYAR